MDGIDSDVKISIPEGKFQAPGDFEIRQVDVDLGGRNQRMELIKQRFSGNCAEYTTLNTAIVLSKIGVAINQEVNNYLRNHRSLDMSTVENDLVIPMVLDAQENIQGIRSSDADVDNLFTKYDNPYYPLSSTNSVLFFRSAINISPVNFQPEEFSQRYTQEVDDRISDQEIRTIFIGSRSHATSYIKMGTDFYYIDPISNNIIEKRNINQVKNHLRHELEIRDSFITFNSLRMGHQPNTL